jgi:hypothetical protein
MALRACCKTSRDRAMGIADRVCVAMAGVTLSSSMVGRHVRFINGTPPGVLFLVTRKCVTGVILIFCFAMGLLDAMMAGTLVMHRRVMIGVSSITLCCSALTLCSTLCSVVGAGIRGGGVKMLPMCVCRSVSNLRPLFVVPAMVPLAANLSVSSRRC